LKTLETNTRVGLFVAAVLLVFGVIIGIGSSLNSASAQQSDRACPEGFSLNRGTCEMEPEITTTLVCPNNLPESPLGNCIEGIASPVSFLCPSTHPYQIVSNPEDPEKVCSTNIFGTGELVEREYKCIEGQELDTTIENVPRCFAVIPKVEQEVQEPCPDGSTLDEDSGLCETRPGGGNGRNNNNN
jgi:hypothetical protein